MASAASQLHSISSKPHGLLNKKDPHVSLPNTKCGQSMEVNPNKRLGMADSLSSESGKLGPVKAR